MNCKNKGLVVINSKTAISCDSFCNLIYKYSNESINVTNKGNYILVTLNRVKSDESDDYSITYNNPRNGEEHKYNLDEMRIYTPSLHSFDFPGNKTAGELILSHSSNFTGKKLLICIPLTKSSGILPLASNILEKILSNVNKMANSKNQTTNIPNLTVNLNKFIPEERYYNYVSITPYAPYSDAYIVVFPQSASITINKNSLDVLSKIIPYKQDKMCNEKSISKSDALYSYSSKAPIYQDSDPNYALICEPTGDGDGEKKDIIEDGPTSIFATKKYWVGIGAILLFIVLIAVVSFILFIIIQKIRGVAVYEGSGANSSPDSSGK